MDQIIENLGRADPEELIPLIAVLLIFGGGTIVAIVSIVLGMITAMVRSKETERSRREIAAYVAEGSMTPEEGERLLRAKNGGKR